MSFPRDEVQATVERYHELRSRIDEGLEPDAFGVLADFYTEDAVYIDGAWGRIEGRDAIAHWLVDSMLGMEDWKFPIEFTAIEGNDVVVKWTQIMPRTRPDGTPYRQSGYSRLIYAGEGKFSYEEDTYNMAHVLEDIEASGWTPNGSMNVPPAHPDRNFDIPSGAAQQLRRPSGSRRSCRSRGTRPHRRGWWSPPLFPVLPCCCCASAWLPRVAVAVRLLSPT